MSMLDTLITRTLPDDPVQRIPAFARDLAEGALNGLWSTKFAIISDRFTEPMWQSYLDFKPGEAIPLDRYLTEKWQDKPPLGELLVSFGFFEVEDFSERRDRYTYILTDKAFQLLQQPIPTSIFISYSRKPSSAFALLLLARLQLVGLDPFLDIKDLAPGDQWHARLENEVNARQHFICLLAPGTLDSPYVRQEILWAMNSGKRTIPIWHSGFRPSDSDYAEFKDFLNSNAIIIENENVKAYNNAVLEVLNYFGMTRV
ncbi:MAG: toll/interleukin-1 receptor domain-containing protein [Anaerolineae bacterium]